MRESTGLKDANGVEICEGDLVQLYYKGNYHVCEIVWNPLGMWSLKWQDGYINNYWLIPGNLKVIGKKT
jgi:hypothetical protein